ncbi:MAG: hypothetical protein QNL85_05100 [Euryarchaeota archaeon]
MSEEPTTLMARDESGGRTYPMYLERLMFVGAVLVFFFLQPIVMDGVDSPGWLSILAGWCGLPIALMVLSESFGRLLQRVLSD